MTAHQRATNQQDLPASSLNSFYLRKELRRRLYHGLLRHLVTIAGSAGKEKPELQEKFELPSSNASHKLFRTVARKMLEQGQAGAARVW